MPLLASNFTSNSLSGTVVVSGGQANIQLPLTAFAFEGEKTFQVKLRRDSNTGSIVGASNTITILDTSTIVSLTANISTVSEGNAITYTLTTANVPNGTNVYYTTNSIVTANVNSSDFTTGNTGVLTINNNLATITLITAADNTLVDESGETFALQIRTNNTAGNVVITSSNVLILDTSTQYNVSKLAESVGSITEGGTITLTLTANVPGGTIMYYDTTGNVSTTNFTTGNTGSFVMNGSSNTITLVTTSTVPYATQADFRVRVKRDSLNGTTLITSNNLLIYDAALTQLQATGGNIAVANGYKTHTFTTTGTFSVSSIASYPGYAEYLILAGGGAGGTASYDPAVGTGAGIQGGGGGAGGFLEGNITIPAIGTYTANVGAGGASTGSPGSNSSVLGLTAIGGGGGSSYGPNFTAPGGVTIFQATAAPGGSGGGGNRRLSGGTGTPGQGYPGGSWTQSWPGTLLLAASGGGGAGGAGETKVNPVSNVDRGTMGGAARLSNTTGTYLGGGGGGATYQLGPDGWGGGQPPASPAKGGGGNGSTNTNPGGPAQPAVSGTTNTGGGGGGGGATTTGAPYAPATAGGSGGSGIVIVRYPFTGQYFSTLTANVSSINQGDSVTFYLSVLNANGITLFYSTDGNVTSSNFIGGNSGSFVANTTGAMISLRSNATGIVNQYENRNFTLQIRQDSLTGSISFSGGNVEIIGPKPSTTAVDYLLVAGGAAGGKDSQGTGNGAGGGGAGGMLFGTNAITPGTQYVVTIGAGGAFAVNGSNSTIAGTGLNLTSVGGGYGGGQVPFYPPGANAGQNGGSGGGKSSDAPAVGSGYGYPGTAGSTQQGNPGGAAGSLGSGGGGAGTGGPGIGYAGGDGLVSSITGTAIYYAGGGGAGSGTPSGPGGQGGGAPGQAGNGTYNGRSSLQGNVNSGGGGGGMRGQPGYASDSLGGSGIAIFRHPNAYKQATVSSNVTISTVSANTIYTFIGSGTIIF